MISPFATFSQDRLFRYDLLRVLERDNAAAGTCLFVMLNPSDADEEKNDPTINRCIAFATRWGFGLLEATNLFALVSTDPQALRREIDPIGPDNDAHILSAAVKASVVIAAWGEHGKLRERGKTVTRMLRGAGVELKCLGMNISGQPKHPLYIRSDQRLIPFDGWR